MIVIDATLLVALVLGTATHPGATFLAAGIVSACLKLLALDLLIHMTATTLDESGFVARKTLTQVASGVANMMRTRGTTRKLLSTDSLTNRDRIQARFAFSFDDGLFSTGTRCNDLRGKRAFATTSRVASFGTVVIFTTELCVANLSTTEASIVQIVNRARNQLLFLSAMTLVLQGFLAFATRATVTSLLASVDSAVQRLFTRGIAKNVILLAALHRFSGPSAAATPLNHCLTGWTWSGMTKQCACMLAKLFPTTKFSTRMGHIASVILRVLFLSTEAVVFPWNLLRHVLACWTTPSVVGFRTASPFGRTGQVQNVVAIRTGPNRLCWSHHIATNETLQLGGIQLPSEFLALRALGDNVRFKLLLTGPIPLIPIRSTVLHFRIFRSIVVIVRSTVFHF